MSWWQKDQEAQQRNETLPMPRELTDEERAAQEHREGLTRSTLEDEDLPWWSR